MSLHLDGAISADDDDFSVTGTVPGDIAVGYVFRLDDEILELRNFARAPVTGDISDRTRVGRDPNHWIVKRGVLGTEAASHDGAAVEGVSDAYTASADQDEPYPIPSDTNVATTSPLTGPTVHDELVALASGDNPPGLFAVLAVSNDTGGVGIVSDATGSGNADASTSATSVDGAAITDAQSTATGSGLASSNRTASSATGNAVATTNVNAPSGTGDATIHVEVGSETADLAISVGGGSSSADLTARAAGSNGAEATANAYSVDGNATATTTATASGTGSASANLNAGASVGLADASSVAQASDGVATTSLASTTTGSGDALSNSDAFAIGTGNASATNHARALGAGATATAGLVAEDGVASVASIKVISVQGTNAEIQVNDLPLVTTGAGAPGATFVSLFYVDTTAVTGGGYLWDFVGAAYIKIGTV